MHIRNQNSPKEAAVGGKKHWLLLGKEQHGLPKMAGDEQGSGFELTPWESRCLNENLLCCSVKEFRDLALKIDSESTIDIQILEKH